MKIRSIATGQAIGAVWNGAFQTRVPNIEIVDGFISQYSPVRSITDDSAMLDASGAVILPGFIDQHIHGVDGYTAVSHSDLDEAVDAVRGMATRLVKYGVTSFLPTTVGEDPKKIEATLGATQIAMNSRIEGSARIQGVHVEGPFLARDAVGAHDVNALQSITDTTLSWCESALTGPTKIITVAPELPGFSELCSWAKSRGVGVSLGHSLAGAGVCDAALHAGASGVTHLFNGMGGIGHRRSSIASWALARRSISCELILDTHMIDLDWMRIAIDSLRSNQIIAVSDGLEGSGRHGSIEFDLCHHRVVRRDGGLIRSGDNAIFGPISMIDDGLKILKQSLGCSWSAIAEMTSSNSAYRNRLQHVGRLQYGEYADLILINPDTCIVEATVCGGELCYLLDDARIV